MLTFEISHVSFALRPLRKNILHVVIEFHRLTGHYSTSFAERNVVCFDGNIGSLTSTNSSNTNVILFL